MKITIIGDIEELDNREYLESLCSLPYEDIGIPICVGDIFGDKSTLPDNLKFIHGNHDNPADCVKHRGYLGDWYYDKELKILYISGAEHGEYEHPGYNSEISFPTCFDILTKIENREIFPDIVISHTAPALYLKRFKYFNNNRSTKSSDCLSKIASKMLETKNLPKYWFHGHMHFGRNYDFFNRIKFRSLGVAEHVTIEK